MACYRGRSSKRPLWQLPASSWHLVKERFIPPKYSSVRAFSRGAMDSPSLHPLKEPPEGTFHIQKVSQCSHFYPVSFILEPRSPIFELTVAMIGYSRSYVAITCTSQVPSKQNWGLASSAIISDVLLGEKTTKSHHWQTGAQRGMLWAFQPTRLPASQPLPLDQAASQPQIQTVPVIPVAEYLEI